jgi:FecR protein
LFRGDFARSGPDLVLSGEDGHRLVVTGYFASEKHPDLVAPNGAHLTGDLVGLLAGSHTHGQYAQAGSALAPEAIGKVEKVVGQVTLIHNGVAGPLHVGDPVFKTDVVQTGPNSSCGIAFPDGTALDLVNNTRMALNEYNYSPDSASNGALFSLVQGTFAFVAGKVAHTGEGMKINTPVATMGIRGTVGLFRSEPTSSMPTSGMSGRCSCTKTSTAAIISAASR